MTEQRKLQVEMLMKKVTAAFLLSKCIDLPEVHSKDQLLL